MTSYAFKEWLTFDEAAEWLSDATGKTFGSDAIERVAINGVLPVHYWPTDGAEIALFSIKVDRPEFTLLEGLPEIALEQCEITYPIVGPVPFSDYGLFLIAQEKKHLKPIGITAGFTDEIGVFGCYRVDEANRPVSITSGAFEVLVHISDLELLSKDLPFPKRLPSHHIRVGVLKTHGYDQSVQVAVSSLLTTTDGFLSGDADSLGKGKVPLLRALAFATHLIAKLGDQIDQSAQQPSHRKNFSRGGSPNISAISKALAEVSTELRYDFKGEGFQKLLREALNEIK